jgi:hypothetical protein
LPTWNFQLIESAVQDLIPTVGDFSGNPGIPLLLSTTEAAEKQTLIGESLRKPSLILAQLRDKHEQGLKPTPFLQQLRHG